MFLVGRSSLVFSVTLGLLAFLVDGMDCCKANREGLLCNIHMKVDFGVLPLIGL